jgi:hypothetical protein
MEIVHTAITGSCSQAMTHVYEKKRGGLTEFGRLPKRVIVCGIEVLIIWSNINRTDGLDEYNLEVGYR